MKKKFVFILLVFGMSIQGCMSRSIKGNGHIVKKEYKISDYNKIVLTTSGDIHYDQKDGEPYLRLEIDDNLLDLVSIGVDGKSLKIDTKGDFNTKHFTVYTNSSSLVEALIASSGDIFLDGDLSSTTLKLQTKGSGDIVFNGSITGTQLEIRTAGSGDISLKGYTKISQQAKITISGSGDIMIDDLQTNDVDASVRGSGGITVSGTSVRGAFNMVGSGDIQATGLQVDSAACTIKGSGNIVINATKKLDAEVYGSGDIRYAGNPEVTQVVAGSGSVSKK